MRGLGARDGASVARPPTVDDWLTTLLGTRLGQAGPWPPELHRYVQREARARGLEALAYLESIARDGSELARLTSAATVGHTSFFRHAEHFQELARFACDAVRHASPLRVWSIGCSTGEEAWSIALTLQRAKLPFTLLATDVNPRAIAVARAGSYHAHTSSGFWRLTAEAQWSAPPELSQSVRFEVAALQDEAPPGASERFDLLFCRNLLIYLSPAAIAHAWRTLLERVEPWGAVVVSPVESLNHVPPELRRAGPLGWFQRA
jgi:chemotaxis methyl-accepting protein methylase